MTQRRTRAPSGPVARAIAVVAAAVSIDGGPSSSHHALGAAAAFVGPVAPVGHRGATAPASSADRAGGGGPLLFAAPARIEENADGVLYVNDRCINCAACSGFAPDVFARSPRDNAHIVHTQPSPSDPDQLDRSRAALASCPVGAIRAENSAKLNHASKAAGRGGAKLSEDDERLARMLAISPKLNGLEEPFPRPLRGRDGVVTEEERWGGVHYLGHHSDRSFGAVPYLARGLDRRGERVSVMVDTPRFSKAAARTVTSLTGEGGPTYLLLTHVDDTVDHGKWAEHFPNLKRIFHEGDLGRYNWTGDETLGKVEVLLRGETDAASSSGGFRTWTLDGVDAPGGPEDADGDFAVLHTPGHSPGSISLLFKEEGDGGGVLFTGDTYAYTTRDGGHMSGFPRYNSGGLDRQADTLRRLKGTAHLWDAVAPGHGHARDYVRLCGEESSGEERRVKKATDVQEAVEDLMKNKRTW